MQPILISDTELTKTMKIGFVGLGHMGGNMAARFLAAGYTVYGESRDRRDTQDLSARGAELARHAARGRRRCRRPLHVPPRRRCPRDCCVRSRRDPCGPCPWKIWVDVSTVSPGISSKLAERVRAHGATMLDAPVSGSVPQVQSGTLTIMVGGDESAYARVEPLLRELGTPRHVGENGQGLLLKLAININLAAQILAFSEGVLLAERGGLDRALAVEVMTGSAIGSPLLKGRAPLVLDLPEDAWFDVELAHKDIRLALATGRSEGVPLPSASVADELLTQASELGYGHRDVAALFEVLSRLRVEKGDEQTA